MDSRQRYVRTTYWPEAMQRMISLSSKSANTLMTDKNVLTKGQGGRSKLM